ASILNRAYAVALPPLPLGGGGEAKPPDPSFRRSAATVSPQSGGKNVRGGPKALHTSLRRRSPWQASGLATPCGEKDRGRSVVLHASLRGGSPWKISDSPHLPAEKGPAVLASCGEGGRGRPAALAPSCGEGDRGARKRSTPPAEKGPAVLGSCGEGGRGRPAALAPSCGE